MLRPRFHTEQSLDAEQLTLEPGPSRHIARTLRMRTGDRLCLFDGSGREAAATLADIGRDAVTVLLEAPVAIDRESPLAVTLAIGVSRGDRMDTVVQKATELGATCIQPLLSERTGVRLDAKRWAKKVEHWRRVAISACEQCGRNIVPLVDEPIAPGDLLAGSGSDADTLRLLLRAAGSHVATFPRERGRRAGRRTVLVYRWYPDRFAQWAGVNLPVGLRDSIRVCHQPKAHPPRRQQAPSGSSGW